MQKILNVDLLEDVSILIALDKLLEEEWNIQLASHFVRFNPYCFG